jgi:hypothetical protein
MQDTIKNNSKTVDKVQKMEYNKTKDKEKR